VLFRYFAATILLFLLKPFSFVNNQRWHEEDAFIKNYSLFFFVLLLLLLLKERRKFLGDDEQIVRVPDVLAVHTTYRVFVVV